MKREVNREYFLVWSPEDSGPIRKCNTEDEARKEAQRLAKLHIDQEFIVLETVIGYKTTSPLTEVDYQNIPF